MTTNKPKNTKEAIDFLESHKKDGYYYVDRINERLLIAVMTFLFEGNASTYIRRIRINDED